ncbi:MAG: glycosyltransferase, partial [Coriobacteriia bacterium]
LRGGVNVCVPFWELPHLPESWVPVLNGMDAVLAPTRFIAETCERSLTRPVVHYPQAVSVPGDVVADRARWGIDPGATAYLIAYDAESDTARKNPLAALSAFEQAFADADDVLLLVKLNQSELSQTQRDEVDTLRNRLAGLSNVRFIEGNLPYRDVLSLYASCDVLVSLHRAEGLGLHLMEAMALGRVVVATGWSGNMDFMTAENSCPVPYQLVPVVSTNAAYAPEADRAEQLWAEADTTEAARVLRLTYEQPELRERIGKQAATDMAERCVSVARAEQLREMAAWPRARCASDRERAALRDLLEAARRSQPDAPGALAYRWARAKRRAVLELRARGLYPDKG